MFFFITTLAVKYNFNYKVIDFDENVKYFRVKREDSVSRKNHSFSFSVEERLAVIQKLNILLLESSDQNAKNFIYNKIDAQASFIKKYIDELIHEDTKEIKKSIADLDLTYFPDSIFAIEEVNERYRQATNQIDQYKEKIHEASKQIDQYKVRTTEMSQKYQEATKQIEYFKTKIHNLDTDLKRSKNEINTLTQSLTQSQEIAKYFQKNFEETLASASYQLGHLLIHETRSIRDVLSLPWKIKNIRSKKQIIAKDTHNINTQELSPTTKIITTKKITIEKEKRDLTEVFKTDKKTHELKIACIMDPFTYGSYSPEALFQQLTPEKWENEIKAFSPDLLFIESAWRGKDELWWNSVGKKCDELVAIVEYCNMHNIPTAFWNKEDPVHFDTFINTASLFDFVFTTDIDMIDKYKMILGHERVYLLPFACQPKVNNPIERYERKDAFCFAGAYYVRYPERTKDLDEFMTTLPNIKPIEIYDRNFGKDDPTYMFPDSFKPYIVGTLPFEEIDKAYKGYNYAINLNSVKQSQSMFARRVYEVLASNTVTISNFSRAIRLLFGDLVITSDNGGEIVKQISTLAHDDSYMRNHKLQALRKVLLEHTYKERLNYLVEKIFNKKQETYLPSIALTCFVKDIAAYEKAVKIFNSQTYKNKSLYIYIEEGVTIEDTLDQRIVCLSTKGQTTFKNLFAEIDFIAGIDLNDFYGENYIMDLALATLYFDGSVIGKKTYYTNKEDNSILLENPNCQYRPISSIYSKMAIVKKEQLSSVDALQWIKEINTSIIQVDNGLSIDEFNYCENGAELSIKQRVEFLDINNIDKGISLQKLEELSEQKMEIKSNTLEIEHILGETLGSFINTNDNTDIQLTVHNSSLQITSELSSKKSVNIYTNKNFKLNEIGFKNNQSLYLDTNNSLDLMLIVEYRDSQNKKISHIFITPNMNTTIEIPTHTHWIRFGLRIAGSGTTNIKGIELAQRNLTPPNIVGKAKHLILTNIYPSYDDLYRNGFVHARVKAYQKEGANVDVFQLQKAQKLSYYEFDNVDVTRGAATELDNLLKSNNYKSILVHFLDEFMWDVLKNHIDKTKVFVWIHGSEIQPWHRREFNYTTQEELEKAKIPSAQRMKFWKSILKEPHPNLKLIFVSQYFAEEVQEDLELQIPNQNKVIIHNYINTDLFNYIPKDIEQRKKILSIRPYASRKYANDLSVEAILELSKKPYFNELTFHMMGDGILFDETLEPLKKFSNVHIERRFLSQSEIAALHKEYGSFLTPTRMDAQGVSRDEAMSSGLIPITNGVTAIPEFVDEECGVLADGDDAHGLAEGIAKIYENPELFQSMSKSAAKRVREQCGFEQTIGKELELFSPTVMDETPTQTSLEKLENQKKILIFGSCVSRDIFNLKNDFHLINYFARSSFASIFQTPFSHPEIAESLESKFQERIVKADMKKSILSDLKKGNFDILLLDFIDERFNLFKLNDSICTLSNEAIKTGLLEEYPDPEIIKNSSQEFFDMWEQGWKQFIELMQDMGQLEKVILNKVYWAEETVSSDNFEPIYSKDKTQQMNIFLDKLYAIAEQSLPSENIMQFSKKVMIGADEHQWGLSPFHYISEYYEEALSLLTNWGQE